MRQADALYREVLRRDPDNADALHLLGRIALQSGNLPVAAGLIERAVEIRPRSVEYQCSLAAALRAQGRIDAAIECYRRAIKLDPVCVEAHNNLGNLLEETGHTDAAIRHLERALALSPQSADAHNNLGITLHRSGNLEGAVKHYRRAIELRADCAEAHFNLGNWHKDSGNLQQAAASYERAFALKLDSRGGRLNLAETLLLLGDFERGWDEYEHRAGNPGPAFALDGRPCPMWQGGPLENKVILLHREQGAGDTIQFSRFIPMVAARGATVILEVTPDLKRLLEQVEGVRRVIVRGEPRPECDLQCPLPSLPRAFAVRLASIPAPIPYIRADPLLVVRWRERLSASAGQMRVGLVWAGSPTHVHDRDRSVRFSALETLSSVAGVSFISLQKGPACAQAHGAGALRPSMIGEELLDFADTAAVLEHLDLIVTVDTAVAHLAGAMGKKAWVMLASDPDWRWMLGRQDSPWYPTLRLFRQRQPGNWPEVIERVCGELKALAARGPCPPPDKRLPDTFLT